MFNLDPQKRRFRLHLSPEISRGQCRLLLRFPSNITVSTFLEQVQPELIEGHDELFCSIDGFAIPPSEHIHQVLRDDEVLKVKAKRRRVSYHLAHTPHVAGVPHIDPWEADRGRLIDALRLCGAAFIPIKKDVFGEGPHFPAWQDLWREALEDFKSFCKRSVVRKRQLRFSKGEDLLRTRVGESKAHTPDVRYNFGVGHDAASEGREGWRDLAWICDDFRRMLSILTNMVKEELSLAAADFKEPCGTLAAKVLSDCESWAGSRLRHSLYPPNGSCTEHTDYGVLTLQQSTGPGLEYFADNSWQTLEPPNGFAVIFAGDMLEVMTNGQVRALVHRVSPGDFRQSHIVFLQPDRDTIVQPLQSHLRKDGTDFPPVTYGEWHSKKTSLAFRKFLPAKGGQNSKIIWLSHGFVHGLL
ncbi:unnamed protein product [Durusdinium trenchii]|uniref:1-aminocyclopropane-1-carboxylate oxidase 1 (ACC oxidase 1) (AtACO1) n=2 Tax=Durusdinium trenchii TaxID=1381693 RepID=A0ABP0SBZ2_9DINO